MPTEVCHVNQTTTAIWKRPLTAICLPVLCALAMDVLAAQPPLLIVDDLKAADDETSAAEAMAYSEFIRQQITPRGTYRTLQRTAATGVLRANLFQLPCYDLDCFLAMGRLLKADYILTGNLVRGGTRVELTLRLIDVKKKRIINSVLRDKDPCGSEELMGMWGLQVLADGLGISIDKLGPAEEVTPESAPTPTPTPNIQQILADQFPDMIYVPPGRYTVGSDDGDLVERPARTVYTTPFLIGRYEVTIADYREFVADTGHAPPSNWPDGKTPEGEEKRPVTCVTWDDAMAYAEWMDSRLPSEVEWEVSARGPKALKYPWGNEFDVSLANTWESEIRSAVDVGSYPDGRSFCGAMDMAGNVAEWLDEDFKPYPKGITTFQEYHHGLKVIRGGSWIFPSDYARASNRYRRNAWYNNEGIGFRLARDAVPMETPAPELEAAPAPTPTPMPSEPR